MMTNNEPVTMADYEKYKTKEVSKIPDELIAAVRQYKHNDGSGIVFAFDFDVVIEEWNKLLARMGEIDD